MSQTPKVQRFLVVSGSSEFTLSVSQEAVPIHVEPSGSIARATDGTLWQSLDGGNWQSLGTGTPDGSTLSILTGVLNALPLSGTINARFVSLSGTIDGHFTVLSGTIDAKFKSNPFTLTGDLVVPGSISGSGDAIFGRNVYLSGALTGAMGARFTGPIDMGSKQINNLADPTAAQDAVTLSYLNSHTGSGGGGTTLAIGANITGGTSGSVLFVGTGSLFEQNPPAFFWNNGGANLHINQTGSDPANGSGAITLKNTLATSLVQICFLDQNGVFKQSYGFNNSGANMYVYNNTNVDYVIQVGNGATTHKFKADGTVGINTSSPAYQLDVRNASTATKFHLASTTGDDGMYLISSQASQAVMAGGMHWNGSSFIAKATSGGAVDTLNGDILFYNGTGFTVGATISPTTRWKMYAAGGFEISNSDSATVSAANAGKIRYTTSGQKLQSSTNAVGYKDILTGSFSAAGSIVFSDANGNIAENNTKLKWDNTNFRFTDGGDLTVLGSLSGSGDAIFGRNVYLSGALTGAMGARFTGPLDMGSKAVSNVADPVAGQDAVTLAYFNANAGNVSGSTVFHDTTLSGTGLVSSPLTVLPRYMGAWTAGTYQSGAIVTRNGYTFAANRTTSEDPLFSEGDISSSANWLLGSSGINNVPISGGYPGAPDTYAVFVNSQTSKTGQAISKSTGSDWNGKIIAYDASVNGSADAFSFGILDAAYPFTSITGGSPLNTVPTAWGVYVDIFNQQIKSLVDGTSSTVQAGYSTANATAKGNSLDRWYVSWALTGSSSASIEFWRNDASNLNNPRLLVKFTVPKPTYTAYRVAAGGWSGGIAGTFYFRGATTRVSSSGDWTRIGSTNPASGLA